MSLRPIKHLGQNFLRDPNTARKIVGSLCAQPTDPVIEIGPGTGALTELLWQKYENLTVIEVDYRAADLLRKKYPDVRIIEGDVLETQWGDLFDESGRRLHVIGNLPYNITSPILFDLLDSRHHIAEAVIMVQYEVARRFVAKPSTKSYGILSVAVQQASEVELLFPVSRNVFVPKPDVRSAVVKLTFDEGPVEEESDIDWFREVVRTAFNQRRKMLRNSLRTLTDRVGRALPDEISDRRAEELTPSDFVRLASYLQAPSENE